MRRRRPFALVCACLALAAACSPFTNDGIDGPGADAGGTTSSGGGSSGAPSGSSGSSSGASASSSGGSSGQSSSGGSSGQSSSSSGSSSGEPQDLDEFERFMLDGINAKRAAAQPTPNTPLPPVRWSETLDPSLEAAVGECSEPSNTFRFGMSSGTQPPYQQMLDLLFFDQSAYDFANNSCSGGLLDCRAYRYMVNAAVTEVACAHGPCNGEWVLYCSGVPTPTSAFTQERPYIAD